MGLSNPSYFITTKNKKNMENAIIVPFDLNTARKIKSGEINQRGISASLMFECVMMWNYILEEGLEDWDEDDYGFYGLPLFKATAVKYGWDNPIGEDSGRERKYDSQY